MRTAQVVSLTAAVAAPGCAGRPRQHRAAWAGQPASGRPTTCPDRPVDVWGDGTPGPDDMRCSYEGTAGGQLLELKGTVTLAVEDGALGQVLEAQRIEVIRIKDGVPTGDPVGHASTDAQGGFRIGVVLRVGTYAVRVVGREGQPVAERWVEVHRGTRTVDAVDITIAEAP